MKRLLLPLLLSIAASSALAQSASVTPSATVYSSASGGQLAFTVTLNYPANVSAVSFSAKPPSGSWLYVSTGGTNPPPIRPITGDNTNPSDANSVFGWSYIDVTPTTSTFTFVLSYPASLTGNQVITFAADYRLNGERTPITVGAVTLTPGTPPTTAPVISTQPTDVTVAVGAVAMFSAGATGSPAPTIKWQRSTDGGTTWADLANGTGISGATSASLSITSSAAMHGHKFRAIATNGVSPDATTSVATLNVSSAPAIVLQPRTQAVSTGGTLVLTTAASGFPAPTYQWKKGGSNLPNDTRISGATTTTLTITGIQAADAGSYTVVATNGTSPDATSSAAVITVIPISGFSATHAQVGSGYTPGGNITITTTINYSGELAGLLYSVFLPTGWSFESAVNAGTPSTSPSQGDISRLDWVWATAPASGSTFTYVLKSPATATGSYAFSAAVEYTVGETPYTIVPTPDPLVVSQVLYHSADTNKNWKMDASELTRVIVLFNTRYDTGSGKVRTGAYKIQAGTVDGFATDPAREPTAVVTLATYHSADTNKNAKIDASELTRVIVLFNTRYDTGSGKVRTGAYKPGSGIDGYETNPTAAP